MSTNPNIKIFVSHRIDQESKVITENPLFVNIRCGAAFDKRKPEEYGNMLGDNTGEHISEKRNEFCELTVQYWMWKNQEADYYGLCHYRRFLSFSEKKYKTINGEHNNGCVEINALTRENLKKFRLDNPKYMAQEIEKYDLICMEPISLKKHGLKSNYQAMKEAPSWHNIEDVDKIIEIIKADYPEMREAVDNYFYKSNDSWLYNCWIMNKELFQMFSKFQFDVLFKLEKTLDYTYYSKQKRRTCGVIGERLFGVFVTYIQSLRKYRIKYQQLLFAKYTKPETKIYPAFQENNVPIVLLSSDYYVPYVYVFLNSLMKHSSSNYNYDIIILQKAITDEHKKKLKKLICAKSNFSIRFYNPIYDISTSNNIHVADVRYSEEAYYRMLVPWILKGYSKAIVMDSDIVMVDDIAKLYEGMDVEGYLAAGVHDVVYQGFLNGMVEDTYDYTKHEMGMKNPYNYVNTGVLVMNLEEWRRKYSQKQIVSLMHEKKFRIQEQDILNVLFENKLKFMPIEWNFYTISTDFLKDCVDAAPEKAAQEYYEAEKQPHLYHYASSVKPWDSPAITYADIWWECARDTEVYEELLYRRMDGLYYDLRTKSRVGEKAVKTAVNIADVIAPKGTVGRKVIHKVRTTMLPNLK